jgi:hypothetical protein
MVVVGNVKAKSGGIPSFSCDLTENKSPAVSEIMHHSNAVAIKTKKECGIFIDVVNKRMIPQFCWNCQISLNVTK